MKETITPGGYTQASAIDFEVKSDGLDVHYKMVDTIHRVNKTTPDGYAVKGARLAVLTADGKTVIDEWVSGQHIVDLTDEMVEQADRTGSYVLREPEKVVTYGEDVLMAMRDSIDKAIAKVVPDIDYVPAETVEDAEQSENTEQGDDGSSEDAEGDELPTDEMRALTLEDFVQQAFEVLPYSDEELSGIVEELLPRFEELPTLTLNEVEDFRAEMYARIEKETDRVNEEATSELQETDKITLEANANSSGGYTIVTLHADGTMDYVDVDMYGDEVYHRVSGMVEGERYMLRELSAPAYLQLAPDIIFVASSDQNITLRMTDMLKVARQATNTPKDLTVIAYGIAGVACLLILLVLVILRGKSR